jgi:hypothetical protein
MTTFLENPNPWKLAEDTVFGILVAATGATAKHNAFQGYLPPAGNCWALKVGGGGDVRNTWTQPITELHMDSDINGLFLTREKAQEFALKILGALPILRVANVLTYRMKTGGMPDIRFVFDRLANEEKERVLWPVEIGCEIVFKTQALA